jgi:hypothetical protein
MELKKLLDPRVLVGLGIVVVAIWLFSPNALAGVLSLAIVAACPLGMLLMMKAMGGMGQKERAEGQVSDAGARERELSELRAEVEALQRKRTTGAERVDRPDTGGTGSAGPAR